MKTKILADFQICVSVPLAAIKFIMWEAVGYNYIESSRPEVFCNKVVLRNLAKSTGRHLCQSLFFNIVADAKPATLLKKRVWHRCFPVNFAKFL